MQMKYLNLEVLHNQQEDGTRQPERKLMSLRGVLTKQKRKKTQNKRQTTRNKKSQLPKIKKKKSLEMKSWLRKQP
jgi:anti-sigma factor ChrR (cupin superfamily)